MTTDYVYGETQSFEIPETEYGGLGTLFAMGFGFGFFATIGMLILVF